MKRAVLLTTSIILIFLMDSCNNNKIRGCTDPDSINYDALAERDDGSCQYIGEAVIWYDQIASDGLINDGATALTFYVDDEVVGSSAASVYWTGAPRCGDNGSITVTEDLGRNKRQNFTLSVEDQDGIEYWRTTLDLQGNSCLALKLTWETRKKK